MDDLPDSARAIWRRVEEASASEAVRAIRFALAIDDHYDCREFMAGWLEGDLSEWPEFTAGESEPRDDEAADA